MSATACRFESFREQVGASFNPADEELEVDDCNEDVGIENEKKVVVAAG